MTGPVVRRRGSCAVRMAGQSTALHLPLACLVVDDDGVHLQQPGLLWDIVLRPEARPWRRGSWLDVPWSHVRGATQSPLTFKIDLPDDDALSFRPLRFVGHGLAAAVRVRGVEVRRRLVSTRWRDLRLYRADHVTRIGGDRP